LAGGILILGVALAGPASGDPSTWFGGQPAPGAPAQKVTQTAPVPAQPPAGAKGVTVTKVAPVPKQPVNDHPTKAGPPVKLRHSKVDKGEKNLRPTKDKGVKNLPVRRDLGDSPRS